MSDTSSPFTSGLNAAGGFAEGEFAKLAEMIGVVAAVVQAIKEAGAIEAQGVINLIRAAFPDVPIPPADLADMVERNIITESEGAAEAAMSGVNSDRFARLVLDTGEPPGIMEMLSLYRRGALDEATLVEMIAYSRIRTKWTPQVLELRYSTMSAADAINAVVKGVISKDEGRTFFEHAGGMVDQYDALLEASGDAIGVQQVLSLWLHGLATEEDVKQVILHSRINPQFEPLAAKLYHHWLGAFEIERLLKAGACTSEQAMTWITQLGYPPDQAAAFVHAGTGAVVAKSKDITEAQIVDLYEAKFIDQAEAETLLGHLGYPSIAVSYILEVNDAKKALSQLNKAMGAVQKAYVAGRTDQATALADLARLDVPIAAAKQYVADWDIERSLEFKTLTMAQVGAIYKKGGLTEAEALARWAAMGYDQTDAALLLFDYGGPNPTTAAKG